MSGRTVVTGGAGYIGAMVCDELLAAGREVVVLDVLMHGQDVVAAGLVERGVEVVRGDIRDVADRDASRSAVSAARRPGP